MLIGAKTRTVITGIMIWNKEPPRNPMNLPKRPKIKCPVS